MTAVDSLMFDASMVCEDSGRALSSLIESISPFSSSFFSSLMRDLLVLSGEPR